MFFLLPVGMNYRTERLPLVTFSLIGINVLVWLVSLICFFATDGGSEDWILAHLWLVPANCTWYAPLTSMFVHADFMHLAGNMIFLFLFGACVEDMIGRLRFAIFYLVGGFVAEIVYIAMLPEHFHSNVHMCGASGAISGCMSMYLLLRAGVDIEFKYFFWIFVFVRAGEFEVPAWVAILFWFGHDLVLALLGLAARHSGSGVAFGAHVGGFLAGLGLLAAYRWLGKPREDAAAAETDAVAGARPRMIIDPAKIMAAAHPPTLAAAVTSETPGIFLHDGQQQTGPFTLTQVQAMLQNGEIGHDASYWSEGMADWQSVVELAGQPME
jgi:membrane associated rhomboid family serine protease